LPPIPAAIRIIPTTDTASFGAAAATCFATILRDKPDAVAVLPTGMTPLPFYAALRDSFAAGRIGNHFTYCALDEYCGLPDGDERLFASWVGRELLDPLGIPPARRITFNSRASTPAAEAERIETWIAAHGIDIAVIGLGGNGHVGFNEPGSAFDTRTRVVALAAATIASNAAYWGGNDRVPTQAYTLGIASLHAARHTILLVHGAAKATILRRALTEPTCPEVPASYLQHQPNVTIIADQAALAA
jgi:glucosamine-6-phosphate deaminase